MNAAARKADFPVVGIGASAGGLDAYKQFLQALPPDAGAAFVLIQHLDPNHESMLPGLLSKHTSMKVVQAEDKIALDVNSVYVIPPGKFIRLSGHGLFLDDPVTERGARMSIDYFFRSMAEAQGEKAIAVLLSGTGSDGTLGIREVKEAGGMVMVQSPDSAEHDGMPRSAIATGAVDFVLTPQEMPEKLVNFIKHPYLHRPTADPELSLAKSDDFKSVLHLLRVHTEYDFSAYRRATLERRIHRRMGLKQIGDLGEYVRYLRDDAGEVQLLFRDLLIGVTRFFRDPESWEAFQEKALPRILEQKAAETPLRAWVPGCASGEEAYTLAMMIFDWLDRSNISRTVHVFATDLNPDAIAAGRAGVYPSSIAADVPETYIQRFFNEQGDKFHVAKRLREAVVFATQNVISDPPFSKLDIICCRNLMIYLEPDIQQRMIEMFHFALSENGILFLGSSESGGRPARLFEALSKSHRIYRRGPSTRLKQGSFPIMPGGDRRSGVHDGDSERGPAQPDATELARSALLQRYSPAAVLVDTRGDVQYFQGPLKNYLEFPAGEPTSELPAMALDGLKGKLRGLLTRVLETNQGAEVVVPNVQRDGNEVSVKITAEPVSAQRGTRAFVLVCFEDASEPRDRESAEAARDKAREKISAEDQDIVAQLEYELNTTREDLQSTIEEMETANEELKASNEEVMSMNEELQSTNEELETSREELQSLNEELSTVNGQLEDKIQELEAANNDLVNLLASTDIATIFLDTDLRIRRFTPATADLLRVIDTDVGRPIEDLTPRVNDKKLLGDARAVLKDLQPREAEVEGNDGFHFIRRVRPYRTSENKIEGVVVTFTDVTRLRQTADRLQARSKQQEAIASLGLEALTDKPLDKLLQEAVRIVRAQLRVKYAKVLMLQPDGKNLLLRAGVGWKKGLVGKAVVESDRRSQAGFTLRQSAPVVVKDFAVEDRFTPPSLLTDHNVNRGASVIIGPVGDPWGVLGAHEEAEGACAFTDDEVNFLQAVANILWLAIMQHRARETAEEERRELRQLADALPMQIAVVSAEERYLFNNRAYEEWGVDPASLAGRKVSDLLGADAYARAKPRIEAALTGELQRFELTVTHPGEAPRTNIVTYVPRVDAERRPAGFFTAAMDISAEKRTARQLAAINAELETIYQNAPVGLALFSPQLEFLRVNEALAEMNGVPAADHIGKTVRDIVPDLAEAVEKIRDQVIETRAEVGPFELSGATPGSGGQQRTWLETWSPVLDEDGEVIALSASAIEITKRKREEERIRVISAELDHRVKNLLATVATIARMTGRNSQTVKEFRENFDGRIQAMARTHSNLAAHNWDGMRLRELIEQELAPYAESGDGRVRIEGSDLVLLTGATQSISLAIHELATNAAKYGALSKPGATLSIAWRRLDSSEGEWEIVWQEEGMEGVAPPKTRGFGSRVLEEIVPAQIDAEVVMDFRQDGLACVIRLPAKWVGGN